VFFARHGTATSPPGGRAVARAGKAVTTTRAPAGAFPLSRGQTRAGPPRPCLHNHVAVPAPRPPLARSRAHARPGRIVVGRGFRALAGRGPGACQAPGGTRGGMGGAMANGAVNSRTPAGTTTVAGFVAAAGIARPSGPAEQTLLDRLASSLAAETQLGHDGTTERKYRSVYELRAACGCCFTPAALPTGTRALPERRCFLNAARTELQHPGLAYIEGLAFGERSLLPTLHAWCADRDGQVIDPTWSELEGSPVPGHSPAPCPATARAPVLGSPGGPHLPVPAAAQRPLKRPPGARPRPPGAHPPSPSAPRAARDCFDPRKGGSGKMTACSISASRATSQHG
jgi:hypothetical protein